MIVGPVIGISSESVGRRRARGRGRDSILARFTMTWHCLTEASSSILPSIITAPVPSPISSMTCSAWATSAGSGENTFLAMSICTGCSDHAPTQPSRKALRNWSSQATVSLMSPNGP